MYAPVQPRPVSGASCVDFRLQPAPEADQVVGQEYVGLLQRESGDRRREVERAFALCAVISPDGQYLGAVERQPRIGHMSLILLVIESEVDVAEAPFVVRQFRDGQVAAQGQAVGRHAQRHVRTQYPVDGRGGGQQPQCGTDVQAGDIQPDVVGRPLSGNRPDCEPLVAVPHVEVGVDAFAIPVNEVIAGVYRPGFVPEYRVGRRYARPDQTVVPCDIQPEAEPLASRPVFLAEVYLAPISGHMAVQPCEGYVVQVPRDVRRAEEIIQPAAVLRDACRQRVEDDASPGQPLRLYPEGYRQGVAIHAFDVQRAERHLFCFQKIIQDIFASGRDTQAEIGQCGFQGLHVDALCPYLPCEYVGAPRQGRNQRVHGPGGDECQRQVAGCQFGPRRRRVGAQRQARRTDAVCAVPGSDLDAVQGYPGRIAAGVRGGRPGLQRKRPADFLRGDSQLCQVEIEDVAREPDFLFPFGQRARDQQQQPQRLVTVGQAAGKLSSFEVCVQLHASEIPAAELRPVNLQADVPPGLRPERIESAAPGLQRQV